ncbi:hypothetical protein K505DRAFT_2328 [Melanomma pulvis-pyrius CBS 109.77]|uniref:Uncharacterized protein n=1 Tax=Melanomma pulvis-pyrius CBS 109.77 TaxID=1314802 RepID=A0A6A6XIH5_9PLEO|nr:hypothetical protein K505DRAFT_2328 [Melanomma pulvis-pyrius CBS 109.77]
MYETATKMNLVLRWRDMLARRAWHWCCCTRREEKSSRRRGTRNYLASQPSVQASTTPPSPRSGPADARNAMCANEILPYNLPSGLWSPPPRTHSSPRRWNPTRPRPRPRLRRQTSDAALFRSPQSPHASQSRSQS